MVSTGLAQNLTPYELCASYGRGEITRDNLILALEQFPYTSSRQNGSLTTLIVDSSVVWEDISKAASHRLIDDFIYHEVYTGWHTKKFTETWPEIFAQLSSEQTLMLIHPLAGLLLHNKKLSSTGVSAFAEHIKGNLPDFSYEELQI